MFSVVTRFQQGNVSEERRRGGKEGPRCKGDKASLVYKELVGQWLGLPGYAKDSGF